MKNNIIYLDEIANRLFTGHASIMVGSGFSKNAIANGESCSNFADWNQLGDAFYEKLYGTDYEAKQKKKYLNVLKLAEEVEATFGRPVLDEILKQNIPDMEYEPSELHKNLLTLPWTDVFTTNYDTLLERATKNIYGRKYTTILTKEDLVYAAKPRIIKLHGSFNSIRPFIITEEDYRLYPNENAPFVNTVQQSLLENTLCLIGFSGDDPNFLHWIGWIRDNLKTNVSKIYLIGALDLTPTKIKLLEKRNIITVSLDNSNNHKKALSCFVNYLSDKAKINNIKLWPYTTSNSFHKELSKENFESKITELTKQWKEQRISYPGWLIMPFEKRQVIYNYTEDWIYILCNKYEIDINAKIEFMYELLWRLNECLYPLDNKLVSMLEDLIKTKDLDKSIKNFFILNLLRYFRQCGYDKKWHEYYDTIIKDKISSSLKGELDYEEGLFYLFELNYQQLKKITSKWSYPENTPLQNSKKSGILAEIGQLKKALEIEKNALNNIRLQETITPSNTNCTLLSQESYILMFYYHLLYATLGYSSIGDEDTKYMERQTTLDNYLCSPEKEINHFKDILSSEYKKEILSYSSYNFDIGEKTIHLQGDYSYTEELNGFNFLLFCEKVGIPFSIHNVVNYNICLKQGNKSVERIVNFNLYWALSTFCRIANTDDIEKLFNRECIYKYTVNDLNSLCNKFVDILLENKNDVDLGEFSNDNFSKTLASILPEIISRLCSKASNETKFKILILIKEILISKNRSCYKKYQNLIRRFMNSLSTNELNTFLIDILKIPIPQNIVPVEEYELLPPLTYIDESNYKINIVLDNSILTPYFEAGVSNNKIIRNWGCTTLITLYNNHLLSEEHKSKLITIIWSQLNSFKLPANLNYYKTFYLKGLYPKNNNPLENIKKYLDKETLNIKNNREVNTYIVEINNLVLDNYLSKNEAYSIISYFISYWKNNRKILKEKDSFMDISKTAFIESIYLIQKSIVLMCKHCKIEIQDDIKNFIKELKNYNFSTLYIESELFQNDFQKILKEIRFKLTIENDLYRINVLEALNNIYINSSDKVKNCLLNMLLNSINYDKSALVYLNLSYLTRIISESNDCDKIININSEYIILVIQDKTQFANYVDNKKLNFDELLLIREELAKLLKVLKENFYSDNDFQNKLSKCIKSFKDENDFSEINNLLEEII